MAGSVKKNYLYNLAAQILTLIVPLVTTPYVARVLEADGVGAYSFAESVVTYFVLFAVFGTASYGQRQVSYLQDDCSKRSRVFWNTFALRLLLAAICLAAYLAFASVQDQNQTLFLILAFNIVNVMVDITWLFQGMENFKAVAVRNIAVKLLGVAFIFIFVREKSDLCLYALGMILITIAGSLSVWPLACKLVEKPRLREVRPFDDFGTVLSLFVPTVAISIYTVLDKTMIGFITASAFENGYYEQAMKVSKMALSIVTSLGAVMASRVGHHYAKGETEAVREYMYKSFRFLWMLAIPLCLGLAAVASSFVPWFFGPGYDKVVPLLWVTSLLIPVIGMSNIIGIQLLVPTQRQRLLTISVCAGALCNFALNMFFIPEHLSIGAAVASVMAECVVTGVQLFCVRKDLSIGRLFACGWKNLVAGLVMFAVLLALSRLLVPSIVGTMLLIAAGVAIYAAMLLILRDSFFNENVRSLFTKLLRRY